MRSIIINMTWKSCTKMFVNTRRFKIRNSKIKIFIFLVFFNSVINSWTSVELSKPWYHQTLSFPGKTESLSLVFVPSVLAPLLKLHLVHKKFVIVNNVIKNGTIFFIYFTIIILSLCKILHNKNQWKTAHYSSFLTFMILYYFSLSLLNCLNIWFVPVAVKPWSCSNYNGLYEICSGDNRYIKLSWGFESPISAEQLSLTTWYIWNHILFTCFM